MRIDNDWRGIVFKPNSGDVYVLLYVAHHDDAYRWAENRKLAVEPRHRCNANGAGASALEAVPAAETSGPTKALPAACSALV